MFERYEASRALGEPIELYEFRYGTAANAVIRVTNAEQPRVWNGQVFEPVPMERGEPTSSGSLERAQLKLKTAIDTDVSNLFKGRPPSNVVSVVIRQGHATDPENEFLVVWSGRILSARRDDSVCELTCEPIATSMQRTALRRHYQLGCPHVLYGSKCRANKAAFSINARAISFNADTGIINLGANWFGGFSRGSFTNGICEWAGSANPEYRTILRTGVQTIKIAGDMRDLVAGTTVCTLSLGCAHTLSDCENVFRNVLNFGGMPWIPTANPVGNNPFN